MCTESDIGNFCYCFAVFIVQFLLVGWFCFSFSNRENEAAKGKEKAPSNFNANILLYTHEFVHVCCVCA